jgi:TPR repeat protein
MSLASSYTHGRGVTQSYERAFHHHLQASESGLRHRSAHTTAVLVLHPLLPGLPVALYNVGGHYFAGKGVELSFKKAVEYYQQAADMGFAPAQVPTLFICQHISPEKNVFRRLLNKTAFSVKLWV